MNWIDMIPWLTAGAAMAAIVRQAVVLPWARAREKEGALFRGEMERLASELDMFRRDLRLVASDMYALRRDMGQLLALSGEGKERP